MVVPKWPNRLKSNGKNFKMVGATDSQRELNKWIKQYQNKGFLVRTRSAAHGKAQKTEGPSIYSPVKHPIRYKHALYVYKRKAIIKHKTWPRKKTIDGKIYYLVSGSNRLSDAKEELKMYRDWGHFARIISNKKGKIFPYRGAEVIKYAVYVKRGPKGKTIADIPAI